MKKITMIFALIVASLAVSCQKDNLAGAGSSGELQADAAYVTISIDAPKSRVALDDADDGGTKPEPGVGDESKVSSLALLAFDANYDYIGSHHAYIDETSGAFECEVAPDARRFFAVVNPTQEIWTAINGVSSFTQAQFAKLPAIVMTAASVSTENLTNAGDDTRGFTMVNCGAMNSAGILVESLVSVNTELSDDPDNPTPVEIAVDRLVSKFEYTINASFDTHTETKFGEESDKCAEGKVLGVALTATNKAALLYSRITKDDLTGGNVYRTDHNMAVGQGMSEEALIIDSLKKHFNWLKNENEDTDAAFITPEAPSPEYVLENTCEPSYSDSNNLTQAIVKAEYNPTMTNGTILPLGTSWFKILTSDGTGTLYLTFDEVVDLYNDDYADFTADAATKASMDLQLDNIMGTEGNTWADAGLTLAALDARPYGGYKAATVEGEENYVIHYFQNAVNYYDIFIEHDKKQDIMHMGRWGMVRNNSYTMDITGIMQEGLPFIPDPTDDKIVDPENKDPKDPEPADPVDAFISVSIVVNPWVLWTQSSPLL